MKQLKEDKFVSNLIGYKSYIASKKSSLNFLNRYKKPFFITYKSKKKTNFNIKNIASIKSTFDYYEKEGDLIFKSSNELKIINKEKFAKKFQLSEKKFNNVDKIFFDLEKNIEKDEFYILNLRINKADSENKLESSVILKNIKLLRNLLKNISI